MRTTSDNPIVTSCARPAVEAPSQMTSSPSSSLQPSQGSPHRWDGFRRLRGVNRTRKIFEDAFDSSKSPWPSIKGRAKPVAESSADPFLVAKTLTIATRATHHCLDDFCIYQNSLQLSLQSTYWLTKSWLLRTPIREFDSLQCPFPKGALLRTLRSFLKPSPSSSLFSNFPQRVSHRVCRLQVTENRYTPDALVHVRSGKYPKTSSHKEAITGNSVCVEVSTAFCNKKRRARWSWTLTVHLNRWIRRINQALTARDVVPLPHKTEGIYVPTDHAPPLKMQIISCKWLD